MCGVRPAACNWRLSRQLLTKACATHAIGNVHCACASNIGLRHTHTHTHIACTSRTLRRPCDNDVRAVAILWWRYAWVWCSLMLVSGPTMWWDKQCTACHSKHDGSMSQVNLQQLASLNLAHHAPPVFRMQSAALAGTRR